MQRTFDRITVDTSTTSNSFVDLITRAITISAGSNLYIWFTSGFSRTTSNGGVAFRLLIDGTPVVGTSDEPDASADQASASLVHKATGLSAGAHTIKIQWLTDAGTASIRPVTLMDREHAALLIEESTL